jgi:hypothetical protein
MKPKASAPRCVLMPARSRGGRPRSPEPGSRVSTWLPTSTHDRLIQVANAQEKSVSEIVKVIILNVIDVYPAR